MTEFWLEAADRIGRGLCESALREAGRCSWLGRSLSEIKNSHVVPTVAALGPELYDGTAGVALFLGQLYGARGDKLLKTVAREAIEHAITESNRASSRFGFYTGSAGIAFAAARLAILLDEPDLGRRARALTLSFATEPLEEAPCDVLGGLAGTAIALLEWPDELRNGAELDLATRLGNALADAAERFDGGMAWDGVRATGANVGKQPLTGLSHGAAGMGVVLLELYSRTGIERFSEVGKAAFEYENHVFDPDARNWPDFREGVGTPEEPVFGRAWCHGAPGIALARRRALSLQQDARWQQDWELALDTCRRAARDFLSIGSDVTLCHGLAGCVEPLLEAGKRDEVATIFEPLVEHYGKSNTWPSGLPSGGPNPSLMVGTAGIGWTMLRMHDPKTPSVLLPLLEA